MLILASFLSVFFGGVAELPNLAFDIFDEPPLAPLKGFSQFLFLIIEIDFVHLFSFKYFSVAFRLGNDGLQKDRFLVFDIRNQVRIVANPYNNLFLAGVLLLVGVFDNVERLIAFQDEQHLLKTNAAIPDQPTVLRAIPADDLHGESL